MRVGSRAGPDRITNGKGRKERDMRNKVLILGSVSMLFVLSMSAGAWAAVRTMNPLENPGFETGDFSGWTVDLGWDEEGIANVVTSHENKFGDVTYGPVYGEYFVELVAGIAGSETSCSQTVYLKKGDKLEGWAAFDAWDYYPYYNDSANVFIYNTSPTTVAEYPWYADIMEKGSYCTTPCTRWEWVAPSAGWYTVEYRVFNDVDNSEDSCGLFDGKLVVRQ